MRWFRVLTYITSKKSKTGRWSTLVSKFLKITIIKEILYNPLYAQIPGRTNGKSYDDAGWPFLHAGLVTWHDRNIFSIYFSYFLRRDAVFLLLVFSLCLYPLSGPPYHIWSGGRLGNKSEVPGENFFSLGTLDVEFFLCDCQLVLEKPCKNVIGFKKHKCFSAEIMLV